MVQRLQANPILFFIRFVSNGLIQHKLKASLLGQTREIYKIGLGLASLDICKEQLTIA